MCRFSPRRVVAAAGVPLPLVAGIDPVLRVLEKQHEAGVGVGDGDHHLRPLVGSLAGERQGNTGADVALVTGEPGADSGDKAGVPYHIDGQAHGVRAAAPVAAETVLQLADRLAQHRPGEIERPRRRVGDDAEAPVRVRRQQRLQIRRYPGVGRGHAAQAFQGKGAAGADQRFQRPGLFDRDDGRDGGGGHRLLPRAERHARHQPADQRCVAAALLQDAERGAQLEPPPDDIPGAEAAMVAVGRHQDRLLEGSGEDRLFRQVQLVRLPAVKDQARRAEAVDRLAHTRVAGAGDQRHMHRQPAFEARRAERVIEDRPVLQFEQLAGEGAGAAGIDMVDRADQLHGERRAAPAAPAAEPDPVETEPRHPRDHGDEVDAAPGTPAVEVLVLKRHEHPPPVLRHGVEAKGLVVLVDVIVAGGVELPRQNAEKAPLRVIERGAEGAVVPRLVGGPDQRRADQPVGGEERHEGAHRQRRIRQPREAAAAPFPQPTRPEQTGAEQARAQAQAAGEPAGRDERAREGQGHLHAGGIPRMNSQCAGVRMFYVAAVVPS